MDLIDRQAAIDAVNGLIDRFEQILRDIREANGDDSVCGMVRARRTQTVAAYAGRT